jgi:hypothetical protein
VLAQIQITIELHRESIMPFTAWLAWHPGSRLGDHFGAFLEYPPGFDD